MGLSRGRIVWAVMLMEPAGLMMQPTGMWGCLKESKSLMEANDMGMDDEEIRDINREPVFLTAEFFLRTGSENQKDFTYAGFSYGGNTDVETGCAVPYFDKGVSDEIAGDLEGRGMALLYDGVGDFFYYTDRARNLHVFQGETIEVETVTGCSPGAEVRAYPIGRDVRDGMFAWEEVPRTWIYVTRCQCPYCGYEFPETEEECPECGRKVDL